MFRGQVSLDQVLDQRSDAVILLKINISGTLADIAVILGRFSSHITTLIITIPCNGSSLLFTTDSTITSWLCLGKQLCALVQKAHQCYNIDRIHTTYLRRV